MTELALALDLHTIEAACDATKDEHFGGMEVVACFGDPDCEFVVPLARRARGPRRGVVGAADDR